MLDQKKYVKVSVNQSNLKGKKNGTYYARVCKKGKISKEDLLKIVEQKAPFIDLASFELGLEIFIKSILECVEEGFDVDLFGLGTVGLKGKGSLKIDKAMEKSLATEFEKRDKGAKNEMENGEIRNEFEGSYEKELNQIAKRDVKFSVQFSPSRQVKKHIAEHVEPSFITAKMRKPKIESVEKMYSSGGVGSPSIIKIKGEDLKVVGKAASLYIKTENTSYKISKDAIIHNEPKMLMVILHAPLEAGKSYSIHLSTQYAKMGSRKTSIIRRCIKEFKFEKMVKNIKKKKGEIVFI